jgi:hypothetical protein
MVRRRIFKVGPAVNRLARFGMMKVDRRAPTEESQSHYRHEANGNDADHQSLPREGLFDGKNYQALPVHGAHFQVELVPGEFRVAGYQALEVTMRATSEKSEGAFRDRLLLDIKTPFRR